MIVNGAILETSSAGGETGDDLAAYNSINRVSSTQTNQFHLDVDYTADDFTINFEIGSTAAEGGTLRETSWEYADGDAGYTYDLTGTPSVPFE